jgi:hypothetical protein
LLVFSTFYHPPWLLLALLPQLTISHIVSNVHGPNERKVES